MEIQVALQYTHVFMQAAARERLHQQQEELELMRAQFLQQEAQRSLRSQLDDVKSEVNRYSLPTVVTDDTLTHDPS